MNETIQERIERKLDSVCKILLGNGDVGLCEQVRDNTGKVDELIEREKEREKEEKEKPDKIGNWVVRIIGGMIALGEIFIAYLVYKQGG